MKVLHYTLGFAPERSGGLVRYATDLMMEQVHQGYEVVALYPGKYRKFQTKPSIEKGKSLSYGCYQLVNSLPLAISRGIADPQAFMVDGPIDIYQKFFEREKPDIFHVHTLMGLPKECLVAAKNLGIKITLTSHDYFGLAPDPSFYADGRSWDDHQSLDSWKILSVKAHSVKALRWLQSPAYPLIRWGLRQIKCFKKSQSQQSTQNLSPLEGVDYAPLQAYYQSMFEMVDGFHFNSQLALQVFETNLWQVPRKSKVLPISHAQISPAKEGDPWRQPIRLAYLGPDAPYKGFDFFLDVLKEWQGRKPMFEWHSWGYPPRQELSADLHQHGLFSSEEMDQVYKSFDVLIVPSQWKETFGFIVLEALSQGKMVLASYNVGSKDLLPPEWIFEDKRDLLDKLVNLKENHIPFRVKTLSEHVQELEDFYQEVLEGEESRVSV